MTTSSHTSGRWPTGTDYARSVQHPPSAFGEKHLQQSTPAINMMGIPLVASGQNAVVFLLKGEQEDLAVRCFTTAPSEGSERYHALTDHLGHTGPTAITASKWIDHGIMVDQKRWPIVTMPWVEGQPLNRVVEDAVGDADTLLKMADLWIDMVESLQEADVTHGDLQHGNVLVDPSGAFRLVDLDGCWVPNMKVGVPGESGHPNYQHPRRTPAQWARYGDSFPALVIEVGLRALAADPSLERFLNGENLLFTRIDLADTATELWRLLAGSPDPEVVRLAGILKGLADTPPHACMIGYSDLRSGRRAEQPVTPDREDPLASDRTISRTAPGLAADEGDEWWKSDSSLASAASLADTGDSAPTETVARPREAAPKGASVVVAANADRPSLGARLGKDALISGALGGLIAAMLGSLLAGLIGLPLGNKARVGLFIVLVPTSLGAVLASWQVFLSGARKAGMLRMMQGAALGAVAGAVALAPADAIYKSPDTIIGTEVIGDATINVFDISASLSGFAWAIVAALVGLLIGLRLGLKTGLAAAVGGAVAGFAGGLVFGAGVAEFEGHQLLVHGIEPATMLIVGFIGLIIGAAVGLSSRSISKMRLTIIEGRSKGMETLLPPKRATIGAASKSTLVLPNDDAVYDLHATIEVIKGVPTLSLPVAGRTVVVNGTKATDGTVLKDGDVLTIGGSFIRFSSKGSEA